VEKCRAATCQCQFEAVSGFVLSNQGQHDWLGVGVARQRRGDCCLWPAKGMGASYKVILPREYVSSVASLTALPPAGVPFPSWLGLVDMRTKRVAYPVAKEAEARSFFAAFGITIVDSRPSMCQLTRYRVISEEGRPAVDARRLGEALAARGAKNAIVMRIGRVISVLAGESMQLRRMMEEGVQLDGHRVTIVKVDDEGAGTAFGGLLPFQLAN